MSNPMTPAEKAQLNQFIQDTNPSRALQVLPGTWQKEELMGIDVDAGRYVFIEDGTHIWESFFRHWGWWKTIVLGWYPYTDLRDFHSHEKQGIGRPWLSVLNEGWQALIFRELILLTTTYNTLVETGSQIRFDRDEQLPAWAWRWLSLTNNSWRQGAIDLDREIFDAAPSDVDPAEVSKMVQKYQASAITWRPMMPERAVYHQKYGERDAFYSFER